ncbi:hypothetical protein DSLASN_27800 [Desulfoluna limicola]|uniref:Type IV pilus modification protein PilV n=1 Tax=Desulfoluna limicola TaxID=2810562 RepID=A0ABN6F3X5_9BACT|nr:prepilin-type N-terminal cleavage/methylation domain-containing protein [Desulfoluna limicola]BCS97148.1 hypothetical protein DSLASN_27800 [Desulfoluna limicola]
MNSYVPPDTGKSTMLCPQSNQTQPTDGPEKGFALIEVMVALVIFAVGIMAVLGMQITSISGGHKARNMTEAANIGANAMESLLATDYAALADGNNTVDGKYTVAWDVTADPTGAPANTTSIRLTVQWAEGATNHEVAYDFLRSRDI